MNTGQTLLDQLLRNPDDTALVAAFSDWLGEQRLPLEVEVRSPRRRPPAFVAVFGSMRGTPVADYRLGIRLTRRLRLPGGRLHPTAGDQSRVFVELPTWEPLHFHRFLTGDRLRRIMAGRI